MDRDKVVFIDIDTQKDFIEPDGALYVEGAEKIKPNLHKLMQFAVINDFYTVSSLDVHIQNDPEFNHFPPHCVIDTPGLQKIPQTQVINPKIVTQKEGQDIKYISRHYIIEKSSYNIFTNPHADELFDFINPEICVVFGVATDFCIKETLESLMEKGYKIILVVDAIEGIVKTDSESFLKQIEAKGVKLQTTEEVLRGLL